MRHTASSHYGNVERRRDGATQLGNLSVASRVPCGNVEVSVRTDVQP